MMPGPEQLRYCPHCRALMVNHTLDSGNTFDLQVWSDGYAYAPMLPLAPAVVKCTCGQFFELRKAKLIRELSWGTLVKGPDGEEVQRARDLTADEWLEAIETGFARASKIEPKARVHAWWAFNQPYRQLDADDRTKAPIGISLDLDEPQRANLEHLVRTFLIADEKDALIAGGALRTLARFDEAVRMLGRADERFAPFLIERCRAGDPLLYEITSLLGA